MSYRKREIELLVELLHIRGHYPSVSKLGAMMEPVRNGFSSKENGWRHRAMRKFGIKPRRYKNKGSEYDFPEEQTLDDDFYYAREDFNG